MSSISNVVEVALRAVLERLIRSICVALKEARPKRVSIIQIKAVMMVLKELKMGEELKSLYLLVVTLCAEKGVEVPTGITNPLTQTVEPVPVQESVEPEPVRKPVIHVSAQKFSSASPVKQLVTPKSASKPVAPKIASKPVLSGAGDEVQKRDQQTMNSWRKWIQTVFEGGGVNYAKFNELNTKACRLLDRWTELDWRNFFRALVTAEKGGNYFLSSKANPGKVFQTAPVELVDGFILCQDGLYKYVMAEMNDLDGSQMPSRLVARCWIVAQGLRALWINTTDNVESIAKRIDEFICKLKSSAAPERLIRYSEGITESIERIHEKAKEGGSHRPFETALAGLSAKKSNGSAAGHAQ